MADYLYGKRVDPYRGFRFRVLDVSGAELGGFTTISGLRDETEVVEYREGNDGVTARKLPGFTSADNIVLERGLSVNEELQDWRNQVWNAQQDDTLVADDEFRRDVIVQLLDQRGDVVKQWKIIEAWPAIYEIDTLDAMNSDVLIERVELANEGHYLIPTANGLGLTTPAG